MKQKNHLQVFLTVLFLLLSAVLFSAKGPCTPLLKKMAAWFPFDETGGDIAYNLFGPEHGYLMNGPEFVDSGMVNNALRFDGSNDYVEVVHHSRIDFGTGDFTVEAWIKTTGAYGNIVSKRHQHNSPGYLFMVFRGTLLLQLTDDVNGWFNYIDPRYNTGETYPRVDDGLWHHVAVTVNRDNPLGGKMYMDGVVVYVFNPTNRQGSLDTGANLWIGQQGGGGQYFNGIIDELSLYPKAFNYKKINRIYLAGADGKCKPGPLSVSLNVYDKGNRYRADAVPNGGTGKYSYTWDCSLNLKLAHLMTNLKRSTAKFKKIDPQQSQAWIKVIVTDAFTQKSVEETVEFSLQ